MADAGVEYVLEFPFDPHDPAQLAEGGTSC
jgi:hypothetical protein